MSDNNFEQSDNNFEKGTYGDVVMLEDDSILKTMDLFDRWDLYDNNIWELIFYQSYNFDFIPKIHKVFNNWKIIRIKMEYCGVTLFRYMKNLSFEQRKDKFPNILSQLCRILYILKINNIVHNDIKGSNICIDREGKIKLIDFGFVCMNTNETKRKDYGTFVDGDLITEEIDFRRDLFALGITLAVFLKGEMYEDYDQIYDNVENSDMWEMKIIKKMLDLRNKKDSITIEELYSSYCKECPIRDCDWKQNSVNMTKRFEEAYSKVCNEIPHKDGVSYLIALIERGDLRLKSDYQEFILKVGKLVNWKF